MDNQSIRNFRDFLLQYNAITEGCFKQCVYDLSSGGLSPDEATCIDKCSYKFVKTNNRAMQVYMEIQPAMTQRRIEELNTTAVAAAPEPQQISAVESSTVSAEAANVEAAPDTLSASQ